jgi:hypothetical protein
VECITCAKPITGCVEECGMCFAATMEREFHLFVEQKRTHFVDRVPEFMAKHMTPAAVAEAEAEMAAARHAERVALFGAVGTARMEA